MVSTNKINLLDFCNKLINLFIVKKKLIIVSAPPASGKTYVSKMLAKNLKHVVYLDKDDLVPLSNVAFKVANEPNDREGPFFEKYLRDVEYQVILMQGLEALKYDDIVLINAPFSREVRNLSWVKNMRAKLKQDYDAALAIIWVTCPIEIVHQRMIERNSPRDMYKLKDWDKYVKSQNFSIPMELEDKDDPYSLILFDNANEETFNASMKKAIDILEETNN